MDNLMFFFHILAWAVAVFGTVVGMITLYSAATYENSLRELRDKLDGKRAVFYHWRLLIIAFIAWAFIIAF